MIDNKTWCSLAWNHQFIGPGGNCKPCCRFRGQHVPKDNNLTNYDINEILNSEFMNNNRHEMLNGIRVEGCARCYEEQDSGKSASLREIYNRMDELTKPIDIDKPKIIYLESGFSNGCNLKFVMCDPYFSRAWATEDLSEISDLVRSSGPKNIDINSIKNIIPSLVHLKFTGGEPMLIKEYNQILELVAESGNLKDVWLNYSSNLTKMPSDYILDIWSKVKHIEIAASFDGVGKTIEYVRYPSKWETVESNLIKLLKLSNEMNIRIGMRSTIMTYNILNLPDMIKWWETNLNKYYNEPFSHSSWINPTHVTHPEFLSLKVLPQHVKEMITSKLWDFGINKKVTACFNQLCKYMNSSDESHLLEDFKRFTKVIDKNRGISFNDISPEIYNELF